MRIAVLSDSAAITRSLTAIVHAAGHTLAETPAQADLTLTLAPNTAHPTTSSPLLVLTPPIAPHALIQKLMHWQHTQPTTLANGWQLDLHARQLEQASGNTLTLTEKESQLLHQLASAAPAPLPRETLLEAVWGIDSNVDTHTLETHIYRLRSKLMPLTPTAGDILTEHGCYRLVL